MQAITENVVNLTASNICASYLTANAMSADNTIIYNLTANYLSAVVLTADALSATDLSASKLSVSWSMLFNGDKPTYSLANLSTDLSTAVVSLSTALSTDIDTLSDNLSTEISAANISIDNLSVALSNKIFIEDRIAGTAGTSDLTIVKISKADYEALVVDPTVPLDNSTLYIVESLYVDNYGQQIKNLADPIELSDAANRYYVDETTLAVSSALSTDYAGKISNLSIALSGDVDALSANLSGDIV